jgi:hypothetical protein
MPQENPQTSEGNGTKWDTLASMLMTLTTGRKHKIHTMTKNTQKHYFETSKTTVTNYQSQTD